MALPQTAATDTEPPQSAAGRNVAIRRAALRTENTRAARAALVDALIALAEEELSHGREAATVAALAEAGTLFPKRVPEEGAWRGRFVILNRTKAALAQKQDRQADAVEAYEAALAVIPAESGSRDDNAARLQLLVRLARSRLAIGDATAVLDEMLDCEAVLTALDGDVPARALDAVRAAVLGHTGVAKAMLGETEAAAAKLAESIALLDRIAAPELADLRRQVLSAWAQVLRQGGGDPSAILASATAPVHHCESCGCGDPHPHDHCGADGHHDHNHDHHHAHARPHTHSR